MLCWSTYFSVPVGRSVQSHYWVRLFEYNPHYIAITANDQLLVADCGYHCISLFTLDGNYVGKFGTQGMGRGQLNGPSGIAVDVYGFILVTEDDNYRVSIFDKDGALDHLVLVMVTFYVFIK